MIPKAQLLALAKHYELLPTTVQKDYVIGWLLRAISGHSGLSQWVFKGGTCLKKCFFETYRFSEDLDFTIPLEQSISADSIETHIDEAANWIESNSGLSFPRQDWKIEEYINPRGKPAQLQ
jgi:predicted nucleotidyltransferase component of viral defense system